MSSEHPKARKSTKAQPQQKPSWEPKMSLEFMLVTFPEDRTVQANGNSVGVTNHTLMLPADEYIVTLSGGGYAPASQDVALVGTSVMKPRVVVFSKAP